MEKIHVFALVVVSRCVIRWADVQDGMRVMMWVALVYKIVLLQAPEIQRLTGSIAVDVILPLPTPLLLPLPAVVATAAVPVHAGVVMAPVPHQTARVDIVFPETLTTVILPTVPAAAVVEAVVPQKVVTASPVLKAPLVVHSNVVVQFHAFGT